MLPSVQLPASGQGWQRPISLSIQSSGTDFFSLMSYWIAIAKGQAFACLYRTVCQSYKGSFLHPDQLPLAAVREGDLLKVPQLKCWTALKHSFPTSWSRAFFPLSHTGDNLKNYFSWYFLCDKKLDLPAFLYRLNLIIINRVHHICLYFFQIFWFIVFGHPYLSGKFIDVRSLRKVPSKLRITLTEQYILAQSKSMGCFFLFDLSQEILFACHRI